jgi:7-keto-8-aminopelargonate synthetase-like enzyme
MSKTNSFLEIVDQIVTDGVNKGILHLYTEDTKLSDNIISLKNNNVVNFGSCSYLGLEFDERLKDGAKQAVDNYGTQFSESRAYVSIRQYAELEDLLRKLFDAECVVTPTTTLGHIASIPVLVGDADAVIVDQQVHNSVQTAVQLLKARGCHIEILRHNRMDLLEEKIRQLRSKYRKIWYMADGIYSMFGDTSPVDEVYALMDKYPELHYYVDDAHGMSIYGKHGRGYVLNNRPFHPKMVMGTSLNKAFASGGGVMLYPNAELARKVRTCGGPLITSGPMQPASLGAAIAAAKIHLSDEIYEMQQDLQENIRFAQLMIKKYDLPLISNAGAAVFFIGVSLPKMGYNMVKRMLNAGYYLNLGIFPAVPIKNTGIRFTITRLHTFAQIEQMIATMATEFPKALREEGLTLEQIYKAFKIKLPEETLLDLAVSSVVNQSLGLTLENHSTIRKIDRDLWNDLFAGKGNFDWQSLVILEQSFLGNKAPEDNWIFDYVIIKDNNGKIVLATFLTTALWKDDMLALAGISETIEQKRLFDPYYLTSTTISTGSLLTEGEHIYIDKTSALWKDAMQLFFEKIYQLQEKYKASNISLRDFYSIDAEMDSFLIDNGFFRIAMPETNIADISSFNSSKDFVNSLSYRGKQHYRPFIARHEGKFDVAIRQNVDDNEIEQCYQLYLTVKKNNLSLNTFALPKKVFKNLCQSSNWEVLTLSIKDKYNYKSVKQPVCIVLCCTFGESYIPVIIGMDYSYHKEYNTYRQALYQMLMRAIELKSKKIHFGFAAGIEKKKVGAKQIPVYAYMQTKDNYNFDVIAAISNNSFADKK